MYGKGPIGGPIGGPRGPIGGPRPGLKGGPAFGGKGKTKFPGTGKGFDVGGFEEEDRSRDWYCPGCRERNFVKRGACFKCGTHKPKDDETGASRCPQPPANGTTLNGMVKSYNRKGFGFLMCLGEAGCQDIYYTRENLSPKLQTRDIPGQHVTFEIQRFPDGKLTALNIRPIGEDKDEGMGKGAGARPRTAAMGGGPGEDEDRSRDWVCTSCSERNFVKRGECFKCKRPRADGGFSDTGRDRSPVGRPAAPPARTLSPHAGSRAVRDLLAGGRRRSPTSRSRNRQRRQDRSRSKKRGGGSGKSSSGSESSASSDSNDKEKKEKKDGKKDKRKKSRDRSSSSSSSSSSSGGGKEKAEKASAASAAAPAAQADPEVNKAKSEALEELLRLKTVEPKEARMSEWRALLRKWHPDKNPDRNEVATAVFQFLQKGKAILDDVR